MANQITTVIFGASGDLTRRKLVPALFSLHLKGRLPDSIRVVGFANDPLSREEFHARLRAGVEQFDGGPPSAAKPSGDVKG